MPRILHITFITRYKVTRRYGEVHKGYYFLCLPKVEGHNYDIQDNSTQPQQDIQTGKEP